MCDQMSKYNLKNTFVETLQLQYSIPKSWFNTIKNTQKVSNTEDENTITVNSTLKKISKTACKDFYWHIINYSPHIPKSNSHWHKRFSQFPTIDYSLWKQIYKYHSIPQEKQEYKPSNTKSYITPSPAING